MNLKTFIFFLLLHTITITNAQVSKTRFFGISPTFSTHIDKDELSYYKEIGLQTIRIHLQQKHQYSDYDDIIETCNQLGIDVMMLVSYESYPSEKEPYEQPWGWIDHYTNSMELVDELKNAVPYFRERGVHSWEIWNEQNGVWFLKPHEYALLLDSVYSKFKYTEKWDTTATIVFGGIDAVGAFHPQRSNPAAREWVKELFSSNEWNNFKEKHGHYPYDVMSIHPYYTYTEEYFNFNIEDVVINTMNKYGDTLKPIWITELGTKKSDPEENANILENYVRAAHQHPRIERFFQFKYTYFGTPETTADHNYFSLVQRDTENSVPVYKPAWFRYKELSNELNSGADLQIDSVWMFPAHPSKGDTARILASIINAGDLATTEKSNVLFEVNKISQIIENAELKTLGIGEKTVIEMDTVFVVNSEPVFVKVFADNLHQVKEKNDANNISEFELYSDNISLSYKGGNSDPLHFKIELEDYDTGGPGVSYNDHTPGNEGGAYRDDDIGISALPYGGFNVGWIWPDEWMNYSDITGADTTYMVYARVASINNDNRFRLHLTNDLITPEYSFFSTQGWENFVVVSLGKIEIPKGKNIIQFDAESDLFNIDYLEFVASDYNDIYCQSKGTENTDNHLFIESISIDDFKYTSNKDNGFGEHTSQTIELTKTNLTKYNFTQGSTVGNKTNCQWNVWIDYNQNGAFEVEEQVINNKTGIDINGSITIPGGETKTGKTRMRISMKQSEIIGQPCEIFEIGEVEDYTVNIAEIPLSNWNLENKTSTRILQLKQNQVNELLKVRVTNKNRGKLTILNMHGSVLVQKNISSSDLEINVSDFSNGIYFIMFEDGHQIEKLKFIKYSK